MGLKGFFYPAKIAALWLLLALLLISIVGQGTTASRDAPPPPEEGFESITDDNIGPATVPQGGSAIIQVISVADSDATTNAVTLTKVRIDCASGATFDASDISKIEILNEANVKKGEALVSNFPVDINLTNFEVADEGSDKIKVKVYVTSTIGHTIKTVVTLYQQEGTTVINGPTVTDGTATTIVAPVAPTDTIGVYRSSTRTFYLKNEFTAGPADETFVYGAAGDTPLVGDWDDDGIDTAGVYRSSTRTFYLKNEFTAGPADETFVYGAAGDIPLVGDWNNDGTDTVGVYRSSTRTFYLKNEFTAGPADETFVYGTAGDTPLVGDWNGDGTDTAGVYRSSTRTFYLKNEFTAGPADETFVYGAAGDTPLVGDWDGNGGVTTGPLSLSAAELEAGYQVLCLPNPALLGGEVTFQVMGAGVNAIQVSIYDLGGGLVYQSEFVSGQSITWDLRSEGATLVANGIYLYAVTAKAYGEIIPTEVGKLLILR